MTAFIKNKYIQLLFIGALIIQGGGGSATGELFECSDVRITPLPRNNAVGWFEGKVGPNVGISTKNGKNYDILVAHPTTQPPLPQKFDKYVVKPIPPACNLGRTTYHWRWIAVPPDDVSVVQ